MIASGGGSAVEGTGLERTRAKRASFGEG